MSLISLWTFRCTGQDILHGEAVTTGTCCEEAANHIGVQVHHGSPLCHDAAIGLVPFGGKKGSQSFVGGGRSCAAMLKLRKLRKDKNNY